MKVNKTRIIPVLVLFSLSVTAQINSREGHQYTSGSKSDPHNDTASIYHDDPQEHVHEEVKIIKKRTKAAQNSSLTVGHYEKGKIDSVGPIPANDTEVADVTSVGNEAQPIAIQAEKNTGYCDCLTSNVINAVTGMFGLAGIAGLFLLFLLSGSHHKFLLVAISDVLLSAAGLPVLGIYTLGQHGLILCLLILLLAVICGLAIVFREATDKAVHKWLIYLHIALSFIGFTMLLFFIIAH